MKTTKTLLTASVTGLMLLTAACAERGVRPSQPTTASAQHQHRHDRTAHETKPMGERMAAMSPDHMEKMHQRMMQRIAQAKTPEDHLGIAAHFDMQASRLLRMARRHEELAEVYAKTDNPKMAGDSARHCRNIAKRLREAAEEMQALARMHRRMANP